jgi:hypothetical protein
MSGYPGISVQLILTGASTKEVSYLFGLGVNKFLEYRAFTSHNLIPGYGVTGMGMEIDKLDFILHIGFLNKLSYGLAFCIAYSQVIIQGTKYIIVLMMRFDKIYYFLSCFEVYIIVRGHGTFIIQPDIIFLLHEVNLKKEGNVIQVPSFMMYNFPSLQYSRIVRIHNTTVTLFFTK